MHLVYPASLVPCIANYRCSIHVHEVIELLIPDFYFVWAQMDLLFQRQSWQERSHGGGREEQLCWVGYTEDKTQLWYPSWPNLRHWLWDSTVDNQVQSGCNFMPVVFRLHVESESCWAGNPKWHKSVLIHHLMVMSKKHNSVLTFLDSRIFISLLTLYALEFHLVNLQNQLLLLFFES